MGPGAVYGVLKRKSEFDVGIVFATDERVWAFDLMVLRDDRASFPATYSLLWFAGLSDHAPPSEPQMRPRPRNRRFPSLELLAPRVLPDLLAGAREEERTTVEKPKRSCVPRATKVKRSKKTKSSGPRLEQPEPAPKPAAEVAPEPTAQATMSQSRRPKQRELKLPPGQRWKERRLLILCAHETSAGTPAGSLCLA
jgi:hypothetical protein